MGAPVSFARARAAGQGKAKVALRHRHRHAVFLEQVPDTKEHVARDVTDPRLGAVDPDPQVEFDPIVAELLDPAYRCRFGENAWRDARGFDSEPLRKPEIAIERDAKADMNSDVTAGERPILDLIGHQPFVRDQMLLAITGQYRDCANADFVDPSKGIPDRDDVAGLDRSVEQQDQTCDQIAKGLLQAEPDRKPESSGKDGERGKINPQQVDTDEDRDGDDRDLGELLEQYPLGCVE